MHQEHSRVRLEEVEGKSIQRLLASGIAHDLNNLLIAINGHAEMALASPQDAVKHLERILRAGGQSAILARRLLSLGRPECATPQPLNLNQVVAEMSQLMTDLLPKSIRLEWHSGGNLPLVLAEPVAIRQLVINSAVHARDEMPRGGWLVIRTSRLHLQASRQERHALVPPGRYVVLSVSDNGRGMDPATLERIFEPFFTTKAAGTGLGLSNVLNAIRDCGGHISVQSRKGEGSTFKVYLPAIEDESTAKSGRQPPAVGGGHETILVVEDDPGVLGFYTTLLQSLGYRVLPVATGQEAQDIARNLSQRIDLLLTDFALPDTSGVDLLEALHVFRPDLSFLMTSGYCYSALHPEEKRPPLEAFLQKPFGTEVLVERIRRLLDRAA